MTNIIKFEKKEKIYILTDFKEEVLKDINDKMHKLNKDTGTNKFNFYTIEEFISLSSLKNDVKNKLKKVNFNIEFISLQIDSEVHNINNKKIMNKNPLDSFKGLSLNTVLLSKSYKIEKEIGKDILKLEGIVEHIDLKNGYLNSYRQ